MINENTLVYRFYNKSLMKNSLVKMAMKGDSEAFTSLIKENKTYLYKIAYSYVKNEQIALDILQESTYKAFINIKKLKKESVFKTWITKIVINECINTIRKNAKITYLNDNDILIKKEFISTEEKLDLYEAIDKLRNNYKTVIILKYFNDLSLRDISYIMEIPENTVKSHLKRAKNDLSKILKEDFLNE
ncbi:MULTISPECIES: sigma-70 family RNA polymerase sigma factor [Clostridium]|uniref:Sigma-70 family RNA polymerase sigma factor n=1 Tax=Clostridium aquiflavi TaxID=3073603 RepID=A0ABU1EEK9_9CLOT|nr:MULTISPECIES: sigma-70 family RNA polymerase sigma factor [unclassified Clostridium]MDR5586792.1 sigma-70 family RNA polymerase sigma factor [Clostridium sp. 5N-1]NFG62642.1 sigma-70 family RNA polymerase sigma factor [Clostridium botulinum]NFQ09996.1 sigma-70 family RNA polymerase sigma factor [Clostridium botulinum]